MAEKKTTTKEVTEVTTEKVINKEEKATGFMSKYMNVISSRFKNVFPVKDDNVKMTMTGELCFPTKTGEVILISEDGELTEYMDELCCDIPAYSICRPKNTIQVGDYIKYKNTYCRVVKTVDKGLKVVTTSGSEVTKKDIKDFITGLPTFRVIISPFSMIPGMNPALLMVLDGKKSMDDILTMSMFSGNNMNMNMAPIMMMEFLRKNKEGNKDNMFQQLIEISFLSQCMGGMNNNNANCNLFGSISDMFSGMGNMFGGLFGGQPQQRKSNKSKSEEVFFSDDEGLKDEASSEETSSNKTE